MRTYDATRSDRWVTGNGINEMYAQNAQGH